MQCKLWAALPAMDIPDPDKTLTRRFGSSLIKAALHRHRDPAKAGPLHARLEQYSAVLDTITAHKATFGDAGHLLFEDAAKPLTEMHAAFDHKEVVVSDSPDDDDEFIKALAAALDAADRNFAPMSAEMRKDSEELLASPPPVEDPENHDDRMAEYLRLLDWARDVTDVGCAAQDKTGHPSVIEVWFELMELFVLANEGKY